MAYARRRCSACGQSNLRNQRDRGTWRYAEYDSSRVYPNWHICQGGSTPSTPSPLGALSTPSTPVDVTDYGLFTQAVKNLYDMQGTALETLRQMELAAAAENIEQAKTAARAQVREMVPVEHFITFDTSAGLERVEGTPHRQLTELVQVLALRIPSFLIGPAGSGKTTATQQAATVLGLDFTEASMGPATSEWDLLGYRSPTGAYVPGILRTPYEFGGVLTLDEMDNSNPSVLTALNAAISSNACTFPDGRVRKHDNFVLVACGNTYGRGADRLYVGRNQLDAATLDRYANIDWEYDEGVEQEWAGPCERGEWVKYVQALRKSAAASSMRVILSPRASIFGTQMLGAGISLNNTSQMTIWKGMSTDDRARLSNAVNARDFGLH